MKNQGPKEPAVKGYFFGKGLVDAGNVLKESWRRNLDSLAKYNQDLKDKLGDTNSALGKVSWWLVYASMLFSIATFGTAVMLGISALFVVFLLVLWIVAMIVLGLASTLELLHGWYRGLFFACPKCHDKVTRPYYKCSNPNCSAIHRRLRPGVYGIFCRFCECGQLLPTMLMMGKDNLVALCPSDKCNKNPDNMTIIGVGGQAPICLPVIGETNSGKTSFVMSLMQSIDKELGWSRGYSIDFDLDEVQRMHRQLTTRFNSGTRPDKTSGGLALIPYRFLLKAPYWPSPRIIYLYDPPGEVFQDHTQLRGHAFYSYIKGLFVLLDTEKMSGFTRALSLADSAPKNEAGELDKVISNIVAAIRTMGENKHDDKLLPMPCALMFNKVDTLSLEDRIELDQEAELGAMTVKERAQAEAGSETGPGARFERHALGNCWRTVVNTFVSVRIFAVSTLGRRDNRPGVPFQPRGLCESFMWMLEEIDPSLKNKAFFSFRQRLAAQVVDMSFSLALGLLVTVLALDLDWPTVRKTLLAWPLGPDLTQIFPLFIQGSAWTASMWLNLWSLYLYSTFFAIILPTLFYGRSIGEVICDIIPCTTTPPIRPLTPGVSMARKLVDMWSFGLPILVPLGQGLTLADRIAAGFSRLSQKGDPQKKLLWGGSALAVLMVLTSLCCVRYPGSLLILAIVGAGIGITLKGFPPHRSGRGNLILAWAPVPLVIFLLASSAQYIVSAGTDMSTVQMVLFGLSAIILGLTYAGFWVLSIQHYDLWPPKPAKAQQEDQAA